MSLDILDVGLELDGVAHEGFSGTLKVGCYRWSLEEGISKLLQYVLDGNASVFF